MSHHYTGARVALALFTAFSITALGCQEALPTEAASAESPVQDLGGIALATKVGTPAGAHFNLNLIGVPNTKTATMDGNNGHRIFVNLDKNTKIKLIESPEGESFQVLDANGTDGNGAAFQLPNPDPDGDGVTTYSVYARALGKPGGSGRISTCATLDPDGIPDSGDEEEVCSLMSETLELERTKGRSHFENVSKELLFIYVDLDDDGTAERYGLFDDALQDYLWSYDNNGLKLVQLRFYEVATDVN